MEDQDIVRCVNDYVREADQAKTNRMTMNQDNFDCYHLSQDYSHKRKGQSQEFLAKQAMAVEQICSFMEQGLIDVGQFFKVEPTLGNKTPIISMDEISSLLLEQLDRNKFHSYVSDALKLGLLGSLMIAKVATKRCPSPKYVAEKEIDPYGKESAKLYKSTDWSTDLSLSLVRQEDFYPDPTGSGLYVVEAIEMDYFKLLRMAEENPSVYDMDAVRSLGSYIEEDRRQDQARETGQNVVTNIDHRRKRVTIHECWGTILDPVGNVLYDNAVCAVANDQFLIRKPGPNPFWHGKVPYVVAPLIRVPGSVWHKSLMDAPTKHNQAINELYNLILDSGMMAVHGIRQLRESWLDDQSQVEERISPGETLIVNTSCPPGAKVMERIDTASMSQEALGTFQLIDREFQASALVNDLRLGILPERNVKATEIVAANQTITGVFSGIARIIEEDFIRKLLDLSWMTLVQHLPEMDRTMLDSIWSEERAAQILSASPEELFASTVGGHKYSVFGISLTLNKVKDFKKLTGLLQTVSGSDVLSQEFARKYSFTKLLGELVKSLDINEEKILRDQKEMAAEAAQKTQQGAPTLQELLSSIQRGGGSPDIQSNIPQATTQGPQEGIAPDRSGLNEGITQPMGYQGGRQ